MLRSQSTLYKQPNGNFLSHGFMGHIRILCWPTALLIGLHYVYWFQQQPQN